MLNKLVRPVAGALVAFTMCVTPSIASAASVVATPVASAAPVSLNPFIALSALGTIQSRNAVCAAAVGAAGAVAAAEGQAPAQGCVLPVLDPVAPVAEQAPYAPVPGAGLGLGVGAILAGLVAVAGLAAVLLSGHGHGRLPVTPD